MTTHVLVLPYFSAEEIVRYRMLADVLAAWSRPRASVRCVLGSVCTGVADDPELAAAFGRLMPTATYRCRTTVTGYPARPTAMFWELMDHVEATAERGGFALWFEADMVPARASWLDELAAAWSAAGAPLALGLVQPTVYIPATRALIARHLNGGACYAQDYARRVPAALRGGVFDSATREWLVGAGRARATDLIAFGTTSGLPAEMQSRAAVLHGYRQDKPGYYARWQALALGRPVPPASGPCCDLRTRHLGVTYCPLHDPWTPRTRWINAASIAAARPWFAARRRWRLLRAARSA